MANFIRSLGDENIPTTFIVIGIVMLVWVFGAGDMILPHIQ